MLPKADAHHGEAQRVLMVATDAWTEFQGKLINTRVLVSADELDPGSAAAGPAAGRGHAAGPQARMVLLASRLPTARCPAEASRVAGLPGVRGAKTMDIDGPGGAPARREETSAAENDRATRLAPFLFERAGWERGSFFFSRADLTRSIPI